MDDPVSDDVARVRWGIINLARIGGVAMVVIGIFGLRGVLELPEVVAWILVAAGLADIFLVPRALARKWRSPRP